VVIVLLQKNDAGLEQPIYFFSRALRDIEVIYKIMDKQAYSLVKSIKAFRFYVLHSNIIAYVPSVVVKGILIQPDLDRRRSKWISIILEFFLEIKPTKIVKGQGLANILAESNCRYLEVNFINTRSENQQVEVFDKSTQYNPPLVECTWYKDIIFFLQEL
jgi:hypothetical protein